MSNEFDESVDMEELLKLAEEKKYRQLKVALLELNEVDIATFIEELDSERTVVVFRMLPKALATDVFAELPVETQTHIINSITDKELSEIVEELYVDNAVDRGPPCSSKYDSGHEKINQPVSELSGKQRGKYYDCRVRGLKKEHDGGAVLCLHQAPWN